MDVEALTKLSAWVLQHLLHRMNIMSLRTARSTDERWGLQMKQQSYSLIEYSPSPRMLPPPELCSSCLSSPSDTPPLSGSSSVLADEEVASFTSPSSCYTHNEGLDESGAFLPVPVENAKQHELWMEVHRRLHEEQLTVESDEEENEATNYNDLEDEEDGTRLPSG